MPPRNAPLPNAVNLFNCDICDKGYPRQTDYENHLRSYDHNHRQRLAEMKKLTAANEGESNRPKGPIDMRSIPMDGSAKSFGLGPRFKKIGGAGATAGGNRFKKVGVAVSGSANNYGTKAGGEPAKQDVQIEPKTDDTSKADNAHLESESTVPVDGIAPEKHAAPEGDEDVVMGEDEEEEIITWEEYDFSKPTDCDHTNCPGCIMPATDGIYEDGWVVLGTT